MTSVDDSNGGLDLRVKEDSDFLYSIDSSQMVKILCLSQDHCEHDLFLTFECNMRNNFDTRPIREWLNINAWKNNYPNFCACSPF